MRGVENVGQPLRLSGPGLLGQPERLSYVSGVKR
jgi:hypothetical protein